MPVVIIHLVNNVLSGQSCGLQYSHNGVQPFRSVQFSRVWLFATLWTAAHQASLSITNSWSPPKLISIESVMPSNHLILCHPLLLLPSIPPSIRVFSSESTRRTRGPKYWSFSFSISPSNEHPGLISFRMDWLDLLAVQGTVKSLLQHHSLKASILRCSAFFTIQLSHPYMTTGKTIALTRRTFVGKAMSLLFNMLSRLVITFLPRSKHILISWLQSPSSVILEPPPNKVWHCFHCFPIYLPWPLSNSKTFSPSPDLITHSQAVTPHSLPHHLLETTDLLLFLWICLFGTFHIIGIIQYVTFCVWLLLF